MKNKYPTKEEILAKEIMFKVEVFAFVRKWKEKNYNDGKWKLADKNQAIIELIDGLAELHNTYVEIRAGDDFVFAYNPNYHIIYLNSQKPSIISSLHEFAHHILGPNELDACQWSIWLFKKTFPMSYEKLRWSEHMLVK